MQNRIKELFTKDFSLTYAYRQVYYLARFVSVFVLLRL